MSWERRPEPYPHWVRPSFLTAESAARVYGEALSYWAGARPEWCGYANDIEHNKWALPNPGRCGPSTADLFAALTGPAVTNSLAALTGHRGLTADKTLHGGGVHVSGPDSWLQVHTDYARHPHVPGMARRASLVVFLNPEWRREWGGAFLACDPAGRVVSKVYPEPGRAVLFLNSDLSYHGVEQTAPDAPPRITAACYYVSPALTTDVRLRAMFFGNRSSSGAPAEVKLGISP